MDDHSYNAEDNLEEININIEDFTHLTGGFGRWQKILVSVLVYINMISSINLLNQPFFAPKIDYLCARTPEYIHMSVNEWRNFSSPIEIRGGRPVHSKCKVYEYIYNRNSSGNLSTVSCSSWEYDHSDYKRTIIEDWNLVCENSWLASFSGSLFFMGYFISAIVSGPLSDRYGRRTLFFYGIVIHLIFGILCMISPYYWMFAASRFLLSCGRIVIFLSFSVLVLESVGRRSRETILAYQTIGFSTGMFTLSGVAWFLKNWYYLQLFCTLPSVLLLIFWRIIPESPRWLLTHGKLYEAEIVLRKIMKVNGKDITDLTEPIRVLTSKIKTDDKNTYSFKDLFRNKDWTKLTLLLFLIWNFSTVIQYGLSFNADEIGGNLYLVYVIFAIMGCFTSVIIHILLRRIGRKFTIIMTFILTGIFSLFITAVSSNMIWLRVLLITLSKFFQTISIWTVYVYTTESYPTIIRNTGVGSCMSVGRLGAILVPFLKEASEKFHWRMPFIIIGIVSITSAFLVLPLSETGNTHLKDVMDEFQKNKQTIKDDENDE